MKTTQAGGLLYEIDHNVQSINQFVLKFVEIPIGMNYAPLLSDPFF